MKRSFIMFLMLMIVGLLLSGTVAAEEITISIWDWNQNEYEWEKEMFNNFKEENPDINVEQTVYGLGRFTEIVPMAVRSGDAPDIHGSGQLSLSTVVDAGWLQPLDPYINELYPEGVEAWKERFTETSFVEGINVFDGKIYALPRVTEYSTAILYYNKNLFREAGLDPDSPPETWSEFREYARKITETGDGDYYGFIMPGQVPMWYLYTLANMAQVAGRVGYISPSILSGFDYKAGKYNYEADSMVKTVHLFKKMYEAGSFFPGFESFDFHNASERFGAGQVGFFITGNWGPQNWKKYSDLDFGVARLPIPDEGRGGYQQKLLDATSSVSVALSSQTDHPETAAKVLLYRLSDEVLRSFNDYNLGISPVPAVNKREVIDPVLYEIKELFESALKVTPWPQMKNPATATVIGKMREASPNFGEILQGSLLGQLDYEEAAKRLSEQMNQELEEAIEEANEEGIDVSKDDFLFPDWNPMENYSIE